MASVVTDPYDYREAGLNPLRLKADIVTVLPGGHGAVREAIEIILKRMNLFDAVMERYVV